MEYGCIGEHLGHSFSKEIHNALADYEYEIREIPRDGLDSFMEAAEFRAINVTIPYKEAVIKHLYEIDENAKLIGAVNTVLNRGGRLYGYNTDFYGMSMLLARAGIEISGKKVVILGTGGTSKTSYAVAKHLGAREIIKVGRAAKNGSVTYEELYERHTDAEVIINTTPLGMFPNIFASPIDIDKFPRLSGVADAVYNPLRTPLVLSALERGIPAEGGLYMLVAQGVRASELFTDSEYGTDTLDAVFKRIVKEKENIVLIGMPSCGKSTVGKIIADKTGRELIDTDEEIVRRAKMSIPEIFESRGELYFRELEAQVIRDSAALTGRIISTGGGAVLRNENVRALRENGRIFFIDRPLEHLIPTADRPLSGTKEAVEQRYNERYGIYLAAADVSVCADTTAEDTARRITESFNL